MIHTVLWDLDGVITNTGEIHYQAWLRIFKPLGIPFSKGKFHAIFGMNTTEVLSQIFDPKTEMDTIQRINLEKEALFRELAKGQLDLYPGVQGWLSYFKEKGIRQAIASSAPQANIDAIVADLKIATYFDALVSGAEIAGKPDPGVFLAAARAVGASPSNCLVIEDSIAGIQAANRAAMKSVAVTNSYPPEMLKDASLILSSLEDLPPERLESLLWPG